MLKKKFRTLPQMAWGGEFFSSDIMWWLGDRTRLILHQLPLPRKSLKRGKDILVSTSWWEVANHIRYGIRFTVRILGGITHYLSLIPLTLERSKDRLSPRSQVFSGSQAKNISYSTDLKSDEFSSVF